MATNNKKQKPKTKSQTQTQIQIQKQKQTIVYCDLHSYGIYVCAWSTLPTGRPRPNVTWYLDNTVIDESFEHRPDGKTVNHLSYPNIGRQHLNARLVCVASNTNLTPPNNKVVILDVNCKYYITIAKRISSSMHMNIWGQTYQCTLKKVEFLMVDGLHFTLKFYQNLFALILTPNQFPLN